jgi:hypothetical protein
MTTNPRLVIRESRASRDLDRPSPTVQAIHTDVARGHLAQGHALRRDLKVIDAEIVVTPAEPAKPTNVRISASVLLGTLLAAGFGVHRQPEGVDIVAGAVIAAIALFLLCLWRFELAASRTQ